MFTDAAERTPINNLWDEMSRERVHACCSRVWKSSQTDPKKEKTNPLKRPLAHPVRAGALGVADGRAVGLERGDREPDLSRVMCECM